MESNVGEVVAKGGELVHKVVQPEGKGVKIRKYQNWKFQDAPKNCGSTCPQHLRTAAVRSHTSKITPSIVFKFLGV